MEQFIYEVRPFLYVYGAFMGFVLNNSSVMNFFAGLLTFCAVMILYWRYSSRKNHGMKIHRTK